MPIKIIKKSETAIATQETTRAPQRNTERKTARKVENNIMGWISDLRERKNLEFAQTQVLLGGLR